MIFYYTITSSYQIRKTQAVSAWPSSMRQATGAHGVRVIRFRVRLYSPCTEILGPEMRETHTFKKINFSYAKRRGLKLFCAMQLIARCARPNRGTPGDVFSSAAGRIPRGAQELRIMRRARSQRAKTTPYLEGSPPFGTGDLPPIRGRMADGCRQSLRPRRFAGLEQEEKRSARDLSSDSSPPRDRSTRYRPRSEGPRRPCGRARPRASTGRRCASCRRAPSGRVPTRPHPGRTPT